jgi:hypothetical protein
VGLVGSSPYKEISISQNFLMDEWSARKNERKSGIALVPKRDVALRYARHACLLDLFFFGFCTPIFSYVHLFY